VTDSPGPGGVPSGEIIELRIGILHPELTLRVPAVEDSLPVVRQALRSLGETVNAETEALEDAELAVTEACANAVEHAYVGGHGHMDVSLTPQQDELLVLVSDKGSGLEAGKAPPEAMRGFGLAMIEGIASRFEIRGGDGTEVEMQFPMGRSQAETVDGAIVGVDPAERIMRRLVAIVAAQADMTTERVVEALLVAELVARNALRHLIGDHAEVNIARDGDGFVLTVGPLEEGGAQAVVRDTEVPVVGSIVERLVDGVHTEHTEAGERLALTMRPRSAAA
jgi:serine/threonine-protein kinase RsbW